MISDNEQLQDLQKSGGKKLSIQEDSKKGVVCKDLKETPVSTVNDVFKILETGTIKYLISYMLMNMYEYRNMNLCIYM
jgi:hypothetical protein